MRGVGLQLLASSQVHAPEPHVQAPRGSRTLRLVLEYEGSAYQGFALQPNGRTIQAELEAALSETLQERIRVVAAGRTDAGVHAAGQVVSFRTGSRYSPEVVQRALNARLPDDIVVVEAAEADPAFDARRSARRRWYRYTIWRGRYRSVWCRRLSYHLPARLDVAAMREAGRLLVGRHDFRAFATSWGTDWRPGRSTWRTVYQADWTEAQNRLYFDICADGFLRQMVRGIVGTLLWVGRGKWSQENVSSLLSGAPRGQAGPNVPAHGLTLMRVEYDLVGMAGERDALARPETTDAGKG